MKKSIFVAISAISVLAASLFLAACSPKSSSLNPNEDAMLIESTQQSQETSAEEWERFYAAVEELNAAFFPNNHCVCYALANDSIDDTEELKKKIVYADIDGALEGAGLGATIGGATGSIQNAGIGAIAGAVIVGAYESYKTYDLSKSEASITTKSLQTITQIDGTSIGIDIGMKHNILIDKLIRRNVTFENMSYQQAISLLIDNYETFFSPIDAAIESALLGSTNAKAQIPSDNVIQANQNFKQATARLSITNLHNYTTQYLRIVDRTISNDTDKIFMSTHAGQLYYSTALWVVR